MYLVWWKTVKISVVLYKDKMRIPFVTGRVWMLQPVSCYSHSSMSAVTEAAASEMCLFNSSMSLGKVAHTLSHYCVPIKINHTVLAPDILGTTSRKDSPPD